MSAYYQILDQYKTQLDLLNDSNLIKSYDNILDEIKFWNYHAENVRKFFAIDSIEQIEDLTNKKFTKKDSTSIMNLLIKIDTSSSNFRNESPYSIPKTFPFDASERAQEITSNLHASYNCFHLAYRQFQKSAERLLYLYKKNCQKKFIDSEDEITSFIKLMDVSVDNFRSLLLYRLKQRTNTSRHW